MPSSPWPIATSASRADGGATYFLPRVVGERKALEIALLGERFTAQEAKDNNILNWVVPKEKLVDETEKMARKLADGPTFALGVAKRLIRTSFDNSLGRAFAPRGRGACGLRRDRGPFRRPQRFPRKAEGSLQGEVAMQDRHIGDVRVTRIEERSGPGFPAKDFFPEFEPETFKSHEHWMAPSYYQPESGRLMTVDPFLADPHRQAHDPGRCLPRQSQAAPGMPGFHMLDTQVSRPAARGGRAAGGGRLRDVHASARRSCRLEHQARERQVGADLSRTPST